MNAERRRKLQVLESRLAKLDSVEQRVLADLRRAGWGFRTVEQARHWLKAERTLAQRSHDHLIEDVMLQQARTPKREQFTREQIAAALAAAESRGHAA